MSTRPRTPTSSRPASAAVVPAVDHVPDGCPLTERQYEVLRRVTAGLTAEQTAQSLGITASAVASHASAAYRALGVHNAPAATLVFIRNGWHDIQPAPAATPRPTGRAPFPLPPFAPAYLEALDRHLADGGDKAAARDLSVAAIGLTARKPAPRDRDAFLDRVLTGLGLPARRT